MSAVLAVMAFGVPLAAPASALQFAVRNVGPNANAPATDTLPAGRIQSVALDPSTRLSTHRYLAISDTQLFESRDGGVTWHRLPGLDRYGQFVLKTIAFDPGDPTGRTVFIVTPVDNQVPSRSGIFRSIDGGLTWRLQARAPTPCLDSSGVQDTTLGMAFDPSAPNNIYVGAHCSIGISHDSGKTFSWVDPTVAGGPAPDGTDRGIDFGVTVDDSGTAYLCTSSGIYQRVSDHDWRLLTLTGALPPSFIDCHIAAVPATNGPVPTTLFVTAHATAGSYVDEIDSAFSGTKTTEWISTNLNGPPDSNARPVWLAPRPGTSPSSYQLYWGNSVTDFRIQCSSPTLPHCAGTWTPLGTSPIHTDTSQLLLDQTGARCALLAVGDYGVLAPNTGDCDGTGAWHYRNSGLTSFEVNGIAGTADSNGDTLYISVQDNGFLSAFRPQAGTARIASWTVGGGGDGQQTAVDPDIRLAHGGPPIALYVNNGGYFRAGPRYSGSTPLPPWPNTLGYAFDSDVLGFGWVSHGRFALAARHGTSTQLFFTDDGSSWQQYGRPVPDDSAYDGGNEAVQTDGADTFLQTSEHLYELTGFGARGPQRRIDVPLNGVGVFGAAPSRPSVIYAWECRGRAPCTHGGMVSTTDGGSRWRADRLLNAILRHDQFGNTYPLASGFEYPGSPGTSLNTEASVISFSRTDPKLVIVGTQHEGVLYSIDAGQSWAQLKAVFPFVRGVYWSRDNTAYVAGYGRGVIAIAPGGYSLQPTSAFSCQAGRCLLLAASLQNHLGRPVTRVRVTFVVSRNGRVLLKGHALTSRRGISTLRSSRLRRLRPALYDVDLSTADGSAILRGSGNLLVTHH